LRGAARSCSFHPGSTPYGLISQIPDTSARPVSNRPGLEGLSTGPVASAAAGPFRLTPLAHRPFKLPLQAAAQLLTPVVPAKLGPGGLNGEQCSPLWFGPLRPSRRFTLDWFGRFAPALAIFRVLQIIDLHIPSRRLGPTTAGRRPPVCAGARQKTHTKRQHGEVLRERGAAAISSTGGGPLRCGGAYRQTPRRNFDGTFVSCPIDREV
jgi:hypothetical protein